MEELLPSYYKSYPQYDSFFFSLKKKNSINIPQTKILNGGLKYWSLKNINELNEKSLFKKKFYFNQYFSKKNSFRLWQLINLNIFFNNLRKIKIC
jgi:transglutaminase/protease-like cytokinesis protein 3